jgi:glycosyltransferase involved in cell wall biosynthesis
MKILMLHNRYQHAGGEDAVVQAECKLLESYGHTVEVLEAHNDAITGTLGKAQAALSALYSLPGRRRAEEAISRFRPELVHVHNFFPLLSPSVYDACRAEGVPVVQTLHNYRLACPNALFFREGRLCEDCLDQPVAWPGIMRGCYRGSRMQTAGVAAMLAMHRLRATWEHRVDAFITLTEFQKGKFIQAGLPEARLHVKPNFAFDPGQRPPSENLGGYGIYVGRLSEEKGIQPLLRAYVEHRLTIPLKVLGGGPLLEPMRRWIQAEGLDTVVSILGPQERSEVTRLMQGARFLVFPSICYEGFPMAIAEAFAAGIPVVASRLGAVPDILEGGAAGWLAEPSDPDSWATTLAAAWADHDGARRRGEAARQAFEATYTPEVNYRQLLSIYEAASERSHRHASIH